MLLVVLDGDHVDGLPVLIRQERRVSRHLHRRLAVPQLPYTATRRRDRTPFHSVRAGAHLAPQPGHSVQHLSPVARFQGAQVTGVAKMADTGIPPAFEATECGGGAGSSVEDCDGGQPLWQPRETNVTANCTEARNPHDLLDSLGLAEGASGAVSDGAHDRLRADVSGDAGHDQRGQPDE